MKRVNGLEYGTESWHFEVPDDATVFEHPVAEQVHPPLSNPAEKLQEALQQPWGMPPLDQLVDRGSRVSITMNDWMGGSLYAAPAVLDILRRAGVKNENIRMMVAGGTHAKVTRGELHASRLARWITGNKPPFPDACRILPAELIAQWSEGHERIERHDSTERSQLVSLGVSELGDLVEVNKILLESDLVVHLGWGPLPLSPFGGFLGTGLAIGLSSDRSILPRHAPSQINHPEGIAADPHRQLYQRHKIAVMEKIEKSIAAKIFYIDPFINVDVQFAHGWWAGHWRELREKQVAVASEEYVVKLPQSADILVVGCPGYMLHGETSNPMIALTHVANTMRGYLPPHPVLRKGGVVIMTTPGNGNFDERYRPSDREVVGHYARVGRNVDDLFAQYAEEFLTREDLLYKYRHCYGFHPIHPFWILSSTQYVLDHASKVIYAGAKESEMSRQLGITVVPDLPTAWQMAVAETRPQPQVTVLPNSSRRLYVIFEIAQG